MVAVKRQDVEDMILVDIWDIQLPAPAAFAGRLRRDKHHAARQPAAADFFCDDSATMTAASASICSASGAAGTSTASEGKVSLVKLRFRGIIRVMEADGQGFGSWILHFLLHPGLPAGLLCLNFSVRNSDVQRV